MPLISHAFNSSGKMNIRIGPAYAYEPQFVCQDIALKTV